MYGPILSLASELDAGERSTPRHAPASLPPGKTRYPLYRKLGGPQSWSGRVRKNRPPTGIRSPDRPTSRESIYRLRYIAAHRKIRWAGNVARKTAIRNVNTNLC
jgi:hypothetical protein